MSKAAMPTIQDKKIKELLDKGGEVSGLTVHIDTTDGDTASVDPFGRVTWVVWRRASDDD